MAGTPPGFNRSEVIAGIRTAMKVGAPNKADDQATFCWREKVTTEGADSTGIPFNPSTKVAATRPRRERVACAIDYTDGADRAERFGVYQPSRIVVTLLDPDYAKVADFEYVVWGGDRYNRRTHQVDGLGSLDVHTFYCVAEDET